MFEFWKGKIGLGFIFALALNILVWIRIYELNRSLPDQIRFLNVGQGDASLVSLSDHKNFLIDAGPNEAVLRGLDKALAGRSRRIDFALITHPHLDHFGGLLSILSRYRVGAILYSGREAENNALEWQTLKKEVQRQNIPLVVIAAGDRIRLGKERRMEILSPDLELWKSADLNETSLISRLRLPQGSILFTGDAGDVAEKKLIGKNIRADVLKVGHHGSKYSSGSEFLKQVGALVSVVSVGAYNIYGHPAPATLNKIQEVRSALFRTDESGNVRADFLAGQLRIFTEK